MEISRDLSDDATQQYNSDEDVSIRSVTLTDNSDPESIRSGYADSDGFGASNSESDIYTAPSAAELREVKRRVRIETATIISCLDNMLEEQEQGRLPPMDMDVVRRVERLRYEGVVKFSDGLRVRLERCIALRLKLLEYYHNLEKGKRMLRADKLVAHQYFIEQ